MEQLYTFGDRSRTEPDGAATPQGLAIAYLALVREARPAGSMEAAWQNWYRYFPWEDWRDGRPGILEPIRQKLLAWAASRSRIQTANLSEEQPSVPISYHPSNFLVRWTSL